MDLKNFRKTASEIGAKTASAAKKAGEKASAEAKEAKTKATAATKKGLGKSKEKIIEAMDANGDGTIDMEDIIILGMKVPGVKVDRKVFLSALFKDDYMPSIIDKAVNETPAKAGIPEEKADKCAADVIQSERNAVSAISAALCIPGGLAIAAALPADIIQYYGYLIRVAQKLLYLYGFPALDNTEGSAEAANDEEKTNAEEMVTPVTMNLLTLCLGAMYEVDGSEDTLRSIAAAIADKEHPLSLIEAVTNDTISVAVGRINTWFRNRMSRDLMTGIFKHALPGISGILGGGVTYLTFKQECDKLQAVLKDTALAGAGNTSGKGVILDAECREI